MPELFCFKAARGEDSRNKASLTTPIARDLAGVVGHEDDSGITGHSVETAGDRPTKTVCSVVLDRAENGWPFSKAET